MPKFIVTVYEAIAVEYLVESPDAETGEQTVEYGSSDESEQIKLIPIERYVIDSREYKKENDGDY